MATRIYSPFRERVSEVYCPYPAYGSSQVLVNFSVEGDTPLSVEVASLQWDADNAASWTDTYCLASIRIVVLTSGGGILAEHTVSQTGRNGSAKARLNACNYSLWLPPGANSIGIDLIADVSRWDRVTRVWRNYSPRSIVVTNLKR